MSYRVGTQNINQNVEDSIGKFINWYFHEELNFNYI